MTHGDEGHRTFTGRTTVRIVNVFYREKALADAHATTELRALDILDELRNAPRLSQRDLAQRLGMSLGLLNRSLRQLVDAGYVRVADRNVKPFAYRVTVEGQRYHQQLAHDRYRAVVVSFQKLEGRIKRRLRGLKSRGVHRVVFYGAGEIMEVTQKCAGELGFEVLAAVDDDSEKHRALANGLPILPPSELWTFQPEAVLITTFRHAAEIRNRIAGEPRGCLVWQL